MTSHKNSYQMVCGCWLISNPDLTLFYVVLRLAVGDLGSRLGVDVKNRSVIEAEEREFFQKSIIFQAIASIVNLFQPHREDVTQTRDWAWKFP